MSSKVLSTYAEKMKPHLLLKTSKFMYGFLWNYTQSKGHIVFLEDSLKCGIPRACGQDYSIMTPRMRLSEKGLNLEHMELGPR